MSRIGQVLGERYELVDLLGHGGMGAVYKARHIQMDRFVAVKMLLADLNDDDTILARFFREAKASGKINHPNVVQLIDFGQATQGEAYIVIEFLDGLSLDQVIRSERQLDAFRAVNIFGQICDGVAKAHSKGIIHRDLKPSNVMLVTEEGIKDFVKIVDFGLAKGLNLSEESQRLTQTGEVFGSPIYMSPEQCLGQSVDERSDVYSTGVLMYETLTGKVPIVGANVTETIARQMTEIPKPFSEVRPDLQINSRLEQVVLKALSKSPEQRQASMLELKEELLGAMGPYTAITARPKLQKRSASNATTEMIAKPRAASKPEATETEAKNGLPLKLIAMTVAGIVLLIGGGAFLAFNIMQPLPVENSTKTETATQSVNKFTAPKQLEPSKNQTGTNESTNTLETKKDTENPDAQTAQNKEPERVNKKVKVAHEHSKFIKAPANNKSSNISITRNVAKSAHVESDTTVTPYRKHHHDWSDFSSRYEKGYSTPTWTVPLAGSKSKPD